MKHNFIFYYILLFSIHHFHNTLLLYTIEDLKWYIYKIKNQFKNIIIQLNKMPGLKSLIFGSFMIGSGSTLLIMDIWFKNNKHYKIVKIK